MKKKIATLIMATVFCTTISTMRVEAEEEKWLTPANFETIEQETEAGITIQMLKNVLMEGNYIKGPYYLTTTEGETFESISERLAITKEDLIQENSDYRPLEDGSYSPFVEYVYVAIPEVEWNAVSDEVYYYISKGDTLWGISKYFETTVATIQELNPEIVDVNKIYADTIIKIK